MAARRAGLDLVNLGFSGNAVLDPFTAQAIRDQAADVITLKIGINVVNHDFMRLRAFRPVVEGFLDVVRDGHPSTPPVVISPILCPMVEDCPGPTEIDPSSPDDAMVFRTMGRPEELAHDKLSLRVIRQVLREVVDRRRAAGDTALTYLDGLELYGDAGVGAASHARPAASGRCRAPAHRREVRGPAARPPGRHGRSADGVERCVRQVTTRRHDLPSGRRNSQEAEPPPTTAYG